MSDPYFEPEWCECCGGTGHNGLRCPHEWLSYAKNEPDNEGATDDND